MLDVREARRLDLNAEELGVPVAVLMRNAGTALANAAMRQAPDGRIIVFCGKGNNGGDGVAAALTLMKAGRKVLVVLAEGADEMGRPGRELLAESKRLRVTAWAGKPDPAWADAGVFLDCLLGSGLSGKPRRPYDAIIRYMNARAAHGTTLLSCDVPSGLGTAVAVRPRRTVTFHEKKAGMTRANSGAIDVVDIGIPPAAADIGFGDLALAYRKPDHESHKGQNGVILVVAGSIPLAGAPHYVARGAYRTGADLVHSVLPADAAAIVRTYGPETIVHDGNAGATLGPDAVDVAKRLLPKCTALAIGPGLGQTKATRQAAAAILAEAAKRRVPIVVDADGLDVLTTGFLRANGSRMVLTPHGGEFRDLAGKTASRENVVAFAKANRVTILRKGATDVVTDGTRTRECTRGHPVLTVGGTGDVLTGIVATLLAKGTAPFDAACAASYVSKSAGEVAASFLSFGATAIDVADAIPSVLLRLA